MNHIKDPVQVAKHLSEDFELKRPSGSVLWLPSNVIFEDPELKKDAAIHKNLAIEEVFNKPASAVVAETSERTESERVKKKHPWYSMPTFKKLFSKKRVSIPTAVAAILFTINVYENGQIKLLEQRALNTDKSIPTGVDQVWERLALGTLESVNRFGHTSPHTFVERWVKAEQREETIDEVEDLDKWNKALLSEKNRHLSQPAVEQDTAYLSDIERQLTRNNQKVKSEIQQVLPDYSVAKDTVIRRPAPRK